MQFNLDANLKRDGIPLKNLMLSQVLLMNNKLHPWIILVPKKPNLIEIIDLTQTDQLILLEEINQISKLLRKVFEPYKLNIAALGNQVRQLHIHIIARFEDDAAWPNPVWGGKSEKYNEAELTDIKRKLGF